MVLYHGTSQYRAKLIFESGIIKKDAPRYFTKENNGANFSSNGFVYQSNEITWAYRFAMLHGNVEEENYGYIFKIVIPDEMILADEDELGDLFPHVLQMYSNRLEASLFERKSCRVDFDVNLQTYKGEFCRVCIGAGMSELLTNNGMDYNYTISHYTKSQEDFINSITWIKYDAVLKRGDHIDWTIQ